MSNTATEATEHVKTCGDVHELSHAVWVWSMLCSPNGHYSGLTFDEIMSETKLSKEVVERALDSLLARNPDTACVQLTWTQEGTAGPFAYRWKQRKGNTVKFILRNRRDPNYSIVLDG